MSAPPVEVLESARAAVAQLHEAIDALQTLDLAGVAEGDALLGLLREHERARRRMAATDARLVAEIDARSLAWEKGFSKTAGLVRELLRVSPYEAAARVRAAGDVGPRRTLTGEP